LGAFFVILFGSNKHRNRAFASAWPSLPKALPRSNQDQCQAVTQSCDGPVNVDAACLFTAIVLVGKILQIFPPNHHQLSMSRIKDQDIPFLNLIAGGHLQVTSRSPAMSIYMPQVAPFLF
jgi:hypothetical protein